MIKSLKRFLLVTGLLCLINPAFALSHYEPTHDSVSQHPLPEWFQDAKFGVMIHYGLYSVPGWAPLFNPVGKLFSKEFFIKNPYAEWYFNTMQITNSPTYFYNRGKKYEDFVDPFNQASNRWNPDNWSNLFVAAGAKYVVFVTKHHDGFLLWPSQYPNPYKKNWAAKRDIVGELTQSVRNHKLRMGLYYSGGYDWSFPDDVGPIVDVASALKKVPQSQQYADYVNNQWHELIEKYHPDLLWNDIALPQKVDKWKLFADYYNTVPDGVFNNRWGQGQMDFSIFGQPPDKLVDLQLTYDWFDYYSPEYIPSYHLTSHKWEADHGAGYSFGYNRQEFEHPEHFKTADELIADLADLVSKNGNLLLAVTPEADGTIPELERKLLLDIGDWLNKNGESIYATKPWKVAEGSANLRTIKIRFTQSKDNSYLYLILLTNPHNKDIFIDNFSSPMKTVTVLNGKDSFDVPAQPLGTGLLVFLSQDARVPREHPVVLKIKQVVK